MNFLSTYDFILGPIYLILSILIGLAIKGQRIEKNPEYKYYVKGLTVKLLAGLALCFVYLLYYGIGDTVAYYISAKAMINLSHENFDAFWQLMKGNLDMEYISAFTSDTGYPYYRRDPQAFAVNRFMVPFVFLGAKSFLVSNIVLNFFLYQINFRFFRFLTRLYPEKQRISAIAILFIPSVLFWGAGIMKDSLTFSFSLVIIISLYNILIKPKAVIKNLVLFIIATYIVISIKPYIFFALLAAFLMWEIATYALKIKSQVIRVFALPLLVVVVLSIGLMGFLRLGGLVGGAYANVDTMIEKAVVTQDDLSRDYYGGNSFDIGDIDPSIGGMLSKAPKAVTAGLYRPFLWEANNMLMLLSGLENIVLLLLSLYILIRVGILTFIRKLLNDPFLIFCVIFAIVMAFFIGLTTANFGALVRYRIPMLPFFVFMLLSIYHDKKKSMKKV